MKDGLEFGGTGDTKVWEDCYESLLYTAAALATQADDPDLIGEVDRINSLLDDWHGIELERRRLRGTAVAARARVGVADAALDYRLHEFAKVLLADVDESSEKYKKFFPEHHERVIELGLDGSLPSAMLVVALLDEDDDLGEALEKQADPIREAVKLANLTITERAESYAALGRHEARVEAWLEGARAFERSIRRRLPTLCDQRSLSSRWTESFFPPG